LQKVKALGVKLKMCILTVVIGKWLERKFMAAEGQNPQD
jgi:hypothetical protein